jgi:glycerophosphoryl diester phosphodiesterase
MREIMLFVAMGAISAGAAVQPGNAAEVVAHRGESQLAPENTLAAVELAWQRGADAVEIDIHLTADGHPIVCHDEDTKRTTGRRLVIRQSTLAELRALDAGVWKGAQWKGQKLPTLKEVVDTMPEHHRLFVEVKSGAETVPVLKNVVEASGKRPEQVVVISFHPEVIAEARRLMPRHRAFLLVGLHKDKKTGPPPPTVEEVIADARKVKADGVDLSADPVLDRHFVERLHKAGLEVYAWTVDSPDEARRLIDIGVLGITTNRAGWLKQQLVDGKE